MNEPTPNGRRRLWPQFSLREVLLATALVAAACAFLWQRTLAAHITEPTPLWSGTLSGGIYERNLNGETQYIFCDNGRIDYFEKNVVIHSPPHQHPAWIHVIPLDRIVNSPQANTE